MTSTLSSSGILSSDSFSLIHSREVTDSSESYSSFELSEDPSSEDEIVWSLSDNDSGAESLSPVYIRSQGPISPATFSDDDIVVLSRPRSVASRYQSLAAPGSVEALAHTLSNLNVGASSSRRPRAKTQPAPAPSTTKKAGQPSPSTSSKTARRKKRKGAVPKPKQKQKSATKGPQPATSSEDDARSIVDDVSEVDASAYEEAVQYVSEWVSFVSHATPYMKLIPIKECWPTQSLHQTATSSCFQNFVQWH